METKTTTIVYQLFIVTIICYSFANWYVFVKFTN